MCYLCSSSLQELPQFSNVASYTACQILKTELEIFEPFLVFSQECWSLSADSVESKHQSLHFCELKTRRRCHRPILADWWLEQQLIYHLTLSTNTQMVAYQRHIVDQPVKNVLCCFPRIVQLSEMKTHLSSQLAQCSSREVSVI